MVNLGFHIKRREIINLTEKMTIPVEGSGGNYLENTQTCALDVTYFVGSGFMAYQPS